jgi:hypothetical protein
MHLTPSLSHYVVGTKVEGVLTLVLAAFWSATVSVGTYRIVALGWVGLGWVLHGAALLACRPLVRVFYQSSRNFGFRCRSFCLANETSLSLSSVIFCYSQLQMRQVVWRLTRVRTTQL